MALLKRLSVLAALTCALLSARGAEASAPRHGRTAAAGKHAPASAPQRSGAHAGKASPSHGKPKAALSVGYPNEGRLDGGVRLETKVPFMRVVPAYESGDVRWGLPALVGMIGRSARAVAKRYPGSVLSVGDLSQRDGGDLLRHHSHESGRDADLGFYIVDAKGKPVLRRTFTRVAPDMTIPDVPGATFDMARNWLFLQGLLGDRQARVSHVFVMAELKQRLLAYARKHGASRAMLSRASVVMMQPTDSISHDDHYHVRISCPSSMRGACIEYSKNAPMGSARLARHGSSRALRTPHIGKRDRASGPAREVAAPKTPHAHPAPEKAPAVAARAPERETRGRPRAASLSLRVPSLSMKVPALSRATAPSSADADEAESDGDEVKQMLDDSGFVKITD